MTVSSPVGEFPFTLEHMRAEGGEVIIAGRIGAWPSEIRINAGDIGAAAPIAASSLLRGLVQVAARMLPRFGRPSA
jgi:hypothetical protein